MGGIGGLGLSGFIWFESFPADRDTGWSHGITMQDDFRIYSGPAIIQPEQFSLISIN